MIKATNWNVPDDPYTLQFWRQNIMQFWTDDEIPFSDDKMDWLSLDDVQKQTYTRVLGGLTLLDTIQGDMGMPEIAKHVEGGQRKAVLSVMGMMEHIHAKSYSSIFTTLCTNEEITEIYEWVEQEPHLNKKRLIMDKYYMGMNSSREKFLAMAASVLLESYLFYSGFFYPLYLAGKGIMTRSGEAIDLILRDESIHGVYVGMLAQEELLKLSEEDKKWALTELDKMFKELHENEIEYTNSIYAGVGLTEEVNSFVRYNADKAFMNLGLPIVFDDPEEKVNPIILNGIKTSTKQHDFFSKKGNGYVKSVNIVPLSTDDFNFDNV